RPPVAANELCRRLELFRSRGGGRLEHNFLETEAADLLAIRREAGRCHDNVVRLTDPEPLPHRTGLSRPEVDDVYRLPRDPVAANEVRFIVLPQQFAAAADQRQIATPAGRDGENLLA